MTATRYGTVREAVAAMRRDGKARQRDIAAKAGVSEGELVAAHVTLPDEAPQPPMRARRLAAAWPQIIEALEPVGDVMALTRNESCVHEKVGAYRNCSHGGPGGKMGLVLGGAIDLRIFYERWAHGFAVEEDTEKGSQRSLQFFDAAGVAIHKIFMRPATDAMAWASLIAAFTEDRQRPGIEVREPHPTPAETPDARIDVHAFREAWATMQDTHEFFGLLKAHGVARTQALRLADPKFARRIGVDAARIALETAARDRVPIMAFVGNPGMIQIHSGPVERVAVLGPWLNVLDEGFNLHLRADHIAAAWVVRKPTSDGLVTSLELFDASGQTIAMLFGERQPGRPELETWRALVDGVIREAEWCPA